MVDRDGEPDCINFFAFTVELRDAMIGLFLFTPRYCGTDGVEIIAVVANCSRSAKLC